MRIALLAKVPLAIEAGSQVVKNGTVEAVTTEIGFLGVQVLRVALRNAAHART